ncbi:MAG: thiol peroxidase [Spirochaetota bacterium]
MHEITFKGNPVHTNGPAIQPGLKAPDFVLTYQDLTDKKLSDYSGKKIVLNIFPSIDTSVCAQSVRRFNEEASNLENTVVICISRDLPFAHKRFCAAEGLDDVVTLSAMRENSFGEKYGVTIIDGPMKSLFSRVVIVLDENHNVAYTQQVPEISDEPDYGKAVESLKNI